MLMAFWKAEIYAKNEKLLITGTIYKRIKQCEKIISNFESDRGF